ncbi:MAG: MBL fold metallo-hydrolase [Bacteroidota bacterium]
MTIEQLYTGCLAQGAYFIESDGEAAVIDPLREISTYTKLAKQSGSKIKYIFETHFHADFVSGHIELAQASGATIVYGPSAVTGFSAYIGADNEIFTVGKLSVRLIHTPGHTLESCCYLVSDEDGKQLAIFTGDTLFIGDVGRPDLAQQPVAGLSQDDLAGMLYDSLRNRIMPLADDVMVYPAHGAGSACGKNMSKETSDTLGNQKLSNYALDLNLSRTAFIEELTTGLKPAPAYFPMNVKLNSQGYDDLASIFEKSLRPLNATMVEQELKKEHVMILDTRAPTAFAISHIPGAINIGLNGSFAPWVGALLPYENVEIIIVTGKDQEKETLIRLARVGFENVIGYLEGGMDSWTQAGKKSSAVASISAADFNKLDKEKINIIDVRNDTEYAGSHLDGSLHYPLADFKTLKDLPESGQDYYVFCAGGYRSMIFISLLKSYMDINLINVDGGYGAIKAL